MRNLTIKKRISRSFSILVSLFVISAIAIIVSLYGNKKSARHIAEVTAPSLQALDDFEELVIHAKMYSTSWVFLQLYFEDKKALKNLHTYDYPKLKAKLEVLSSQWHNKNRQDSLSLIYQRFEQLIVKEQEITQLLAEPADYENSFKRIKAMHLLEDEIFPRSTAMVNMLIKISKSEQAVREKEEAGMEHSSVLLTMFIAFLVNATILTGIFLSGYMSRIIIRPVNKIRVIIDDLGKGITKKLDYEDNGDEFAEISGLVNHLSEKLRATAIFAEEIGKRNFDAHFESLSCQDTLGRALLAMRDSLKLSDERLNEVQQIAHLASWECDVANNKVYWSDELYQILDIDPATFDGTFESYLNYLHPEDRDHALCVIKKSLDNHKSYTRESRFVTNKGIAKILYTRGNVLLDEHGEAVKLYGILQDITEQKQSQLALEKAHTELKILFNNIDEVFFSVNMVEYKIIQMSPACEKVYGYPPAAFYENQNLWKEVIVEEDLVVVNNNHHLMLAGRPFVDITRIRHKDGSIKWVETKVIPTLDNTGTLVRLDGVTTDITKRKEAEDALKLNLSELKKSNMELDKFVYSVSHDLRAPLRSILGIIEISENLTSEELILKHLDMLKVSAKRLDNFVSEILDYSRNNRQAVCVEEIDFEEILNDIFQGLRYMNDSGSVDLIKSVRCEMPFLSDKHRIVVILNNLISNAIRYKNSNIEKPFVEIDVEGNSEEVCIIVSDNGVGINEAYHQKIFEMFYRVSENSVGSGLGLYIVKETVDKLNGRVGVESSGQGTKFIIYLPNHHKY